MLNALMFDGWYVEDDYEQDPYSYRLKAHYTVEPERCPLCGSLRKPYQHAHPIVGVRDSPMRRKSVMIALTRHRYLCNDCNRTFSQPIPEVHKDFDMTNRLVEYIQDRGLRIPYTEVAKEVGLRSDATVRNICKPYLAWLEQGHTIYAPVILGIDELKLAGQKRTVLTDTGERRVIDILPDDGKASLVRWIRALPESNRVLAVTLDMRDSYRKVVREELPMARIIADKFHVLRMANKRLDEFRSTARAKHEATREAAREAGRRVPKKQKNKWSDRRVLHMSPDKRAKLKPMKSMMFEATLANDPDLRDVWETKERFYAIWEATTEKEAVAKFQEWRSNIPPVAQRHFNSVAKQIDAWHIEVFEYFYNPYTNAYAEAANRLIRAINRRGHGYKFEGIRARSIHMTLGRDCDHFICEDCLGRFPIHQAKTVKFIGDMLPPAQVCAGGCKGPHGWTLFRAMAFGVLPTAKPE